MNINSSLFFEEGRGNCGLANQKYLRMLSMHSCMDYRPFIFTGFLIIGKIIISSWFITKHNVAHRPYLCDELRPRACLWHLSAVSARTL